KVTPESIGTAAGTALKIEGQNFTADDEVSLDDQPLVNQSLVSDTEIDGETPALTATPREIQIRRCGNVVARFPLQCIQVTLNVPACGAPGPKHFSGNVSSCDQEIARISYSVNANDLSTTLCENCGLNPEFSFDLDLPPGANTINVVVQDVNGGQSSVTKVLSPDTTAPTIQCPADIITENQLPCGTVVEFTVTAQDDCDPNVTVVCTPPSGSLFPQGSTIVKCVATDASGNSAECSFTVNVSGGTQFTAPTITSVSPSLVGMTGGTLIQVHGTFFTPD